MGFSSKHLTVFSPETVNIKKLANLTTNTKNYRQITLNTKPHSDPLIVFPKQTASDIGMLKQSGPLVPFDYCNVCGIVTTLFKV